MRLYYNGFSSFMEIQTQPHEVVLEGNTGICKQFISPQSGLLTGGYGQTCLIGAVQAGLTGTFVNQ